MDAPKDSAQRLYRLRAGGILHSRGWFRLIQTVYGDGNNPVAVERSVLWFKSLWPDVPRPAALRVISGRVPADVSDAGELRFVDRFVDCV